MTERKFRKLQAMLTDVAEKKMMEVHFQANEKGRRQYVVSGDKRSAKKIAGVLTKVRKARRGPRTIRIVLLAGFVLVPVIFNLFFLDILASRELEKVLEKNLATDVGIRNLDISLFKGSIFLEDLSFASKSDPLIDSLAVENIDLDFSLAALFHRRINIQKILGSLNMNRPRTYAAEYPRAAETGSGDATDESLSSSGTEDGVGFDWMPVSKLPSESVELAEELRADAEKRASDWKYNLERERRSIEALIDNTRDYIDKPLPANTDVQAWLRHIDEGKKLAVELKGSEGLIEEYQVQMNESVLAAQSASAQVFQAMEADLAQIEESLIPDDEMINLWVASAIEVYAGPGLRNTYDRGVSLYNRFGGRKNADDRKNSQDDRPGRMKRGRIVGFPVSLPPRFTIGELDLQGSGISLVGSDIGVDHELAGAPSILAFEMNDTAGVPGFISADITVDGRSDAGKLVDGSFNADLPDLTMNVSDSDGVSARLDTSISIELADRELPADVEGRVELSQWAAGRGSLDFVNEFSPMLAFNFEAQFSDTIEKLKIHLDRSSLNGWARVLATSFLPGIDGVREELEAAVGSDLSAIDGVLDGWISGKNNVNDLDSALNSAEDELQKLLDDMAGQAGIDIPLDNSGDAIEGLKSLFG